MRTRAKAPARARGRWEQSGAQWYEQTAAYCDGCGILIPNRQFIVETVGVRQTFCGPECVQLSERVRGFSSRKSAS